MKKFLSAVIVLTLALCMAFATGCKTEMYKLTFTEVDGVEYIVDEGIMSGASVSEGYTISFSIQISEDCEGTPVVKANDTVLTANAEGKYSFEMNSDTVVKVEGISKQVIKGVNFDKADLRIKYLDPTTNEELTTLDVTPGTTLSFKLDISVYYVADNYSVIANTELLEPDANGVYSFTVNSDDVTVSVQNLEQDLGFIDRADGGLGTMEDPFKIEKPIDLFYMASLINNEFYAGSAFYAAYYSLENDIDMGGEQLFIIGDNSSSTAFFAGDFNGNGHTISNYYIDDETVDQESFYSMFMPYIGMFGNVQPLTDRAPRIYDLNLTDFTIEVDARTYETQFMVGGLAGSAMGADITAVNVSGSIVADADVGYFGYMGGLVGAAMSASTSDGMTRYYSVIRSSSSDVDVSADSGYVYAAGGIAGYMGVSDEMTSSVVLNCYNTGDIAGALHTGGLVGYLGAHTSVIGSYSTGTVDAQSSIGQAGSAEADVYTYAYAGGLVGYLDYSTVLYDSFTTGEAYASTVVNGHAFAGDIYGALDPATYFVHSEAPVVLNNYSASDVTIDDNFIKNTLKWHEADWQFNGNGLPTVNMQEASKTINITINFGENTVDGESSIVVSKDNIYIPFSYWHIITDEVTGEYILPEFVDADAENVRSYGYFFDEELTKRVPYSFVPTGDVTLYVGFADYSEISGEYTVKGFSGNVTVELNTDGSFIYANGATVLESDYYYNGDYAILRNTIIPRLGSYESGSEAETNANSYYFNFKAELSGNELTLYDTMFFTAENALTAIEYLSDFHYGSYYAGSSVYTFNPDGTADINGSSATYVINGDTISYTTNAGTFEATITDGIVTAVRDTVVTPLDVFNGVWESSINFGKTLTFDGKGELTTDAGVYAYVFDAQSNTATVDGGATLEIIDNKIIFDGVSYYRKDSFEGTWRFNNNSEPVEITFNGLDENGVGVAIMDYNGGSTVLETYYDVFTYSGQKVITLYYSEYVYAQLIYNSGRNTLDGTIVSVENDSYVEGAVFCLYDTVEGVWVSEVEGLEKLQFNGLGNYDLRGTSAYVEVIGILVVNDTKRVQYKIDNTTKVGSFTYNDVNYTFTVNASTGEVTLNNGSALTELSAPDGLFVKELIDSNGNVYSFDGRGDFSNGGIMTVKTSSGNTSYVYKSNGASYTLTSLDGEKSGSIQSVDSNGLTLYVFSFEGLSDVNLSVNNSFTGSYYVSGKPEANGASLTIGLIDVNGKAFGSYNGEEVEFTYDFVSKVLSFTDDNEATYYIHALSGGELSVNTDINGYGYSTICVKTVDEFYGAYSGTESSILYFDGLGNSRYVNGVAYVKSDNITITVYSYYIDENGNPLLSTSSGTEYLFVESSNGSFTKGNKKYEMIQIDTLYLATAKDENNVEYHFDGIGGAVANGVIYTYKIERIDTTQRLIYLTMTDDDGIVYDAVVNYVNTINVTITLTEKTA